MWTGASQRNRVVGKRTQPDRHWFSLSDLPTLRPVNAVERAIQRRIAYIRGGRIFKTNPKETPFSKTEPTLCPICCSEIWERDGAEDANGRKRDAAF
jgi:hypothetical protein